MQIKKTISIFVLNTIIGLLLYSYLYFSELGEFPKMFKDVVFLIYLLFGANIIGFSIFSINNILNRVPIWRKKIGLRFALGMLINYTSILFLLYVCIFIYIILFKVNLTVGQLIEDYNEITIRIFILTLVLVILLVVSDFLIYSYKFYSQEQIQIARLKREQLELQFEALKTQLSPHYLFNSLNTISSLIYKDIKQTEEYIRKLAGTYKYILDSDKISLISVKEEIEFIKDYCFLLNIRFGDGFNVNFDINNKCNDFFIPPISIQILVENAVKHNVFDENDPLIVDIFSKENSILVKNRIMKSPTNRESFKIGLGNIRKRYDVFTDKKIKIEKNEFFQVELPLLKSMSNG